MTRPGDVVSDDAEHQRTRVRLVQRYVLNPPMKLLTWLGLSPGHVLIETRGRHTNTRRRTVVGMHLDGDTGWVVAEQGHRAGYVRNLEADAEVRVRIGRRWRQARAEVVDGDDAEARLAAFDRPRHEAAVRRFGTELTTLRFDFAHVHRSAKGASSTAADSRSPIDVAGRAAEPAVVIWQRLARTQRDVACFDPAQVENLPEPVRRWLVHAITPGTPLAHAVILEMEGHIRLGRWLPFRAMQVHSPPDGYVWASRARWGPLAITGYDRYADGAGEMRWRLASHVRVMNASGPDISRSAAGRTALDAIFVPTAFAHPALTWRGGSDPDRATAEWAIGQHTLRPELRFAPNGALTSVTMARWANPNGRPWGEYPCGGTVDEEVDFGGIRLPTRLRVGYFFETDDWAQGEFFRARITNATFL